MTENNKVCSKCKASKPTSLFFRDASKLDGYNDSCIVCVRKYKTSLRGKTKTAYYISANTEAKLNRFLPVSSRETLIRFLDNKVISVAETLELLLFITNLFNGSHKTKEYLSIDSYVESLMEANIIGKTANSEELSVHD
jgi:hypothetical protein